MTNESCYSIPMKQKHFKHLLLIGRLSVPGVAATLLELTDYLDTLDIRFSIEKETATCLEKIELSQICETDNLPQSIDLIIVIGGDGSLLNAAHQAIKHNIPIIGIHRGRLGFLTDIHPQALTKLKAILEGEFIAEDRYLLSASAGDISDVALNDVVLMPADAPKMIEFETYINQELVCKQRADGLIIATPTGSTAYALSAGGPIMRPGSESMVILPICPHTLSSRPLVLDANAEIEVRLTNHNTNPINMSCDGIQHHALQAGDAIHIQRHTKTLQLIHPTDYNYFATLREKLGWEKHAERT
jgi:NAD+ kinase